MITVDDWLTRSKADARLIMQVHDELVLEVHQDHADEISNRVTELMCNAADLRVALKVDAGIGRNWDEAH